MVVFGWKHVGNVFESFWEHDLRSAFLKKKGKKSDLTLSPSNKKQNHTTPTMISSLPLLVTLMVGAVDAVSNGLGICDARSAKLGCSKFLKGDRLTCQEPGQEMDWTLKPRLAEDLFHLFAGGESNEQIMFTPGKFVKISLRAKKFGWQYSGLLLYAIDAAATTTDTAIGRWEMTDTTDLFHSYCPNKVLHASASLKPYLTSWRFMPPSGVDSIKFIALVKVGPANTGEFFYPNDVTLNRIGLGPQPVSKWYRGTVNASCSDVCAKVDDNFVCDPTRLQATDSAAAYENQVAPYVTCRRPLLARCLAQGLSTNGSRFCSYPDADECRAANLTVTPTTCDASGVGRNGVRLCPCMCKPGSSCNVTPEPEPPATPVPVTAKPPVITKPTVTTKPATTKPPVTKSTTAPVTKPGTKATPICTQTLGCRCGPRGECDSGLKCALEGNLGFCLKPVVASCEAGQLGCQCQEDASCAAPFTCTPSGVCAHVEGTSDCSVAKLGCPCTKTCAGAGIVCIVDDPDSPEAFGTCGKAVVVPDACAVGSLGCACNDGKCTGSNECATFDSGDICVDARVTFEPGVPPSLDTAAHAVLSALAVLVAAFGLNN
jgi:hypothetical protein